MAAARAWELAERRKQWAHRKREEEAKAIWQAKALRKQLRQILKEGHMHR
jgi:hypothetical protein